MVSRGTLGRSSLQSCNSLVYLLTYVVKHDGVSITSVAPTRNTYEMRTEVYLVASDDEALIRQCLGTDQLHQRVSEEIFVVAVLKRQANSST